jgi:hypothetical protein
MKKIRYIGQIQRFNIKKKKLFKKPEYEDAWCITKSHYFYADEDKSAYDVYTEEWELLTKLCG